MEYRIRSSTQLHRYDFYSKMVTEEKLRFLLEERVTEHSHHCLHNPEFAVTNGMGEEASLLMSCQVSIHSVAKEFKVKIVYDAH